MGSALRQLFVLYVAANMALCAFVFMPWALPRETISGLLGRWASKETGFKRTFAVFASSIVDRIYFWEPNHCAEVYRMEEDARKVLYP